MREQFPEKNESPKVSVITVNFNNAKGLDQTIKSVLNQTYDNFQYLVIDGCSSDGSVELLEKFSKDDIQFISEKDNGIYHAMNKAILLSDGEWLLFMNAGDIFAENHSLEKALSVLQEDTEVIYSDWIYFRSNQLIKASKNDMTVRHQSVIYKKSLHNAYGMYVVSTGVTISDYIFFLSISSNKWTYNKQPLSICDEYGVSSKVSHFYQKIAVDFIFNRRSKTTSIIILFLYPVYRVFKRTFLNFFKLKK